MELLKENPAEIINVGVLLGSFGFNLLLVKVNIRPGGELSYRQLFWLRIAATCDNFQNGFETS
jgi:hypothetical protein